jgi:hypothetical protein
MHITIEVCRETNPPGSIVAVQVDDRARYVERFMEDRNNDPMLGIADANMWASAFAAGARKAGAHVDLKLKTIA